MEALLQQLEVKRTDCLWDWGTAVTLPVWSSVVVMVLAAGDQFYYWYIHCMIVHVLSDQHVGTVCHFVDFGT